MTMEETARHSWASLSDVASPAGDGATSPVRRGPGTGPEPAGHPSRCRARSPSVIFIGLRRGDVISLIIAPTRAAACNWNEEAPRLRVNAFDVAAILVAAAAVFGYVNHRYLRLPSTSGTLLVALVSSLIVVFIDRVVPGVVLRSAMEGFLGEVDFDQTLMHGLLCFLLFAGALHVDLEGLLEQGWLIAGLATVGVLLSVTVVGVLTWFTFGLIGVDVSLLVCLTFGALISPTDPIAVMGLLKELKAPPALEAQIAGESLFNDGIGVVVFMGLASLAHLGGGRRSPRNPVRLN